MIQLYVALGFLNAVLLAVLISTPGGYWYAKGALIFASVFANLALLGAVPDTSGYAAKREPPQGQQLLSCYPAEPDSIYFWMLQDKVPRAYRVAYDRELHDLCTQANRASAQGVRIGIRKRPLLQQEAGRRSQYMPYVLPPLGQPKEGSP